jgi:hypothetical protein
MRYEIKDGGPAFPIAAQQGVVGAAGSANYMTIHPGSIGMSLRDWFAGKAMPAVIAGQFQVASTQGKVMSEADLAEDCYAYADAMLREREKE